MEGLANQVKGPKPLHKRVILLAKSKNLKAKEFTQESGSETWNKWSGGNVASLSCLISTIRIQENTPPS